MRERGIPQFSGLTCWTLRDILLDHTAPQALEPGDSKA
jgi:hypothetical protein